MPRSQTFKLSKQTIAKFQKLQGDSKKAAHFIAKIQKKYKNFNCKKIIIMTI